MLLVKLIKIAYLLKGLELNKYFTEEGCDVEALVQSLPKDIVFKLCESVNVKHNGTEIDATIGLITDFFMPLVSQAKDSDNLPKLIQLLINFKK